ncbi:WYL domain-containing protein [Pseudidiomarina sp. YC-516-91]|uniref:WYL domain-containing protein n=1 Tax=Pseudidiomarina salilacus TaxID=3384452 RepID=UPI003984CA70
MTDELTHGQRERLCYIDFCLLFYGSIARGDLIDKFQMGLASCSRDFAKYKELSPNNLVLKHETKRYYSTPDFVPVFEHDANHALSLCSQDDNKSGPLTSENVLASVELIKPRTTAVACISQAIASERAVKITYASLSSGISKREIVPHSFVNTGHRWHVRGFDRKTNEFRDFVCTRIVNAAQSESLPSEFESVTHDVEWQTQVTLVLVPHPNHQHPQAIELDFQMQNRRLELTLRIAEAKYLLRFWNVDVTEDHSLTPNIHHLWLQNSKEIHRNGDSARALSLAPGNRSQGSKND